MKNKIKFFIKNRFPYLLPVLQAAYKPFKIHTINRISLDIELRRQFKKLKPGIVLDVGSKHSPYKKYIPYTKYLRLDIEDDVDNDSKPDLCCDLQDIKWESDYFDSVIATEVLEHIREPYKAINEIHRVLKKDGICILSTRFMFPYHPFPGDYYRFTWDSFNHLFSEFSKVKIYHHGNRIQVAWQTISSIRKVRCFLLNPLLILNPILARIHFKKTNFPLGFVVYAKK